MLARRGLRTLFQFDPSGVTVLHGSDTAFVEYLLRLGHRRDRSAAASASTIVATILFIVRSEARSYRQSRKAFEELVQRNRIIRTRTPVAL
jgi:hypothetical protein